MANWNWALTKFANPMNLVEITADVIPKPIAATIDNDAVLFAVVVVWLLTTPGRFVDHFTRYPAPGA